MHVKLIPADRDVNIVFMDNTIASVQRASSKLLGAIKKDIEATLDENEDNDGFILTVQW